MTEALSASSQLDALLHEMRVNHAIFRDTSYGPHYMETITGVSRLFLDLFTRSNFTPQSLDVVLPGGFFYEVIGALLAAKAAGIEETHITSLEIERSGYEINKDVLKEIFRHPVSESRERIVMRDQDSPATITLQLADAGNPEQKFVGNSDAAMVFIGNSPTRLGYVFANWATWGKEIQKPFLFAATATALQGEVGVIGKLFAQGVERGGLTPVQGMNGTRNPHALQRPIISDMTHATVFAAVRR